MVIILRVTRGEAWSRETISAEHTSTLEFQVRQKQDIAWSTFLGDRTPEELSPIVFEPAEIIPTGRSAVPKNSDNVVV